MRGKPAPRSIRSATLIGYFEAARAAGLDPERMLCRVGLDPSCMDDLETQISLDSFWRLLSESARLGNCPDFGMRAAIERGVPNLGAVSLLMREAETVEEAIHFYTTHLALHADGTLIQLDQRFQSPLIVTELQARTREESFQATQFCLVGITMQIRWLIGEAFQPDLVSFSFAKPQRMPTVERFFKCPVQFRQLISGLVLNRSVLQRRPVTSAPFLRKLARQQLEPLIKRSPGGFSTRVERLLRTLLDDGNYDSQSVADYFQIDRRTLSRRLANDGETFSGILQRIRMEVACRALAGSDSPLSMIADETGFESLSTFSRWFQQSFGCTASRWRACNAAGDA
ncbi:AraC family transcriptional regulator [Variovorax sp. Varisp41]|jgi:AraC-like DNA-binding protein|uniref:AraC family transcriptional regulator n=1 Tax=unclassified Variovorax TaxID=663243 RepID=UPI000C6B3B83|nr:MULTISPECIES: AraC family transcriptional regulator [unclassified Variovorax]MBS80774.1 hypothetical protein [Variovorax sp.]MCT8177010.1 AraC family transcriptional regulator [Variovorax sp. CY25R-8]